MAPVHAALAIRAGEYANHGGGPLSADSQLTAAEVSYGVPRLKIKEYLDLLGQCDAPKAGAPPVQTPAAARERLRQRATRHELVLADIPGDGNCFYRSVAFIQIDLGLRGSDYRHWNMRNDLAPRPDPKLC